MVYRYLASDKEGRIKEGEIEADSLPQVLQYLAGNQLRPINVQTQKSTVGGLGLFSRKINLTDKVFLTRYLSLMLKVGTDLLSSINILIADFQKPAMKRFLIEVRDSLSRGQPFYQAFADHPDSFSPVFINLVKAAEVSGNLQQAFADLSISLQKEADLRKKVRAAMIYPVILLLIALSIFTFLAVFALPRIAKVFLESGIQPPPFSQIVFTIGLFFGAHAFTIISVFVILFAVGFWFFFKTTVGKGMAAQFLSRVPIIRGLYRDLAIQRFASTFSALMKAGMPIVQTTNITADVVGSEKFRVSLHRIADEGLSRGLTVGEAFKRETVFPSVISNLIAVSEKAGHLEEVLDTVADFYAGNVDANIKGLVAFLEPILLLFMGVLVGAIALAIIIPIYQLTSQF